MQTKLQSSDNFDNIQDKSDSLTLPLEIIGIAHKFENQKSVYLALHNAKTKFYAQHQIMDDPSPGTCHNFVTHSTSSNTAVAALARTLLL
jgi:hypothetical protein